MECAEAHALALQTVNTAVPAPFMSESLQHAVPSSADGAEC